MTPKITHFQFLHICCIQIAILSLLVTFGSSYYQLLSLKKKQHFLVHIQNRSL
jgi:hypothetical protein